MPTLWCWVGGSTQCIFSSGQAYRDTTPLEGEGLGMRAGLPRRLPALRRASGAWECSAMSQCHLHAAAPQGPRGGPDTFHSQSVQS